MYTQRRFILKEDQAFSGFAGIGTERKSCPASVCRFPHPQPVPPFVLDQFGRTVTLLHSVGRGGKDFVDTIIAVKML
jgi:hypothetical protein